MCVDVTDHDTLDYARTLRARLRNGWYINDPVDGWRVLKLVEMDALRSLNMHELEQLRASGKCCCERGPFEDGHCSRGAGRCELFEMAERIIWRSDNDKADQGVDDNRGSA